MFRYIFVDGECVESRGLPQKEVTKLQVEHGELISVKEVRDEGHDLDRKNVG